MRIFNKYTVNYIFKSGTEVKEKVKNDKELEKIKKDTYDSVLRICLSHAVITYGFTGIVADIWFF